MGYDMHVRPRLRGDARPADYYDSANYLRRNIWGMHPTVEAMVDLGMAFWSPAPAWPDYPGEDHIDWDDAGEMVGKTPAGQRYVENTTSILSTHGECTTPGIPSHKFTSNDGWHVTREECAQANAAYHKAIAAGHAHPEIFRDDVIAFLRHAAESDGFEVW